MAVGHDIQHDWTRAGDVELRDYADHRTEAARVAAADLEAVVEADAVVVIVSEHGGRGLWVELGAALALASTRKVDEVLVLAGDPSASVFLHHPRVRLLDDVPSVLTALEPPRPDRID